MQQSPVCSEQHSCSMVVPLAPAAALCEARQQPCAQPPAYTLSSMVVAACSQHAVRALERAIDQTRDNFKGLDQCIARVTATATRIGDRLQVGAAWGDRAADA